MFRENIISPIDPIQAEYIEKLNRLEFEPDCSLTCAGIALLRKRIENYQGIAGCYLNYEKESTCLEDFSSRWKIDRNVPALFYYRFNRGLDTRTDMIQSLNERGFETKDTINLFMKNKLNVQCLAAFNKERNSAVIFTDSKELKVYHLLISFMPILFPKLFEEKPLEEEDYNIIKSLTKSDKSDFIKSIQVAIRPYTIDFRRALLGNLLKQMHETHINAALNNVTNQRNEVDRMEREYSAAIQTLKDLIRTYEGMKATERFDAPEEDLVEYLAMNKNVHNMNIVHSRLYFTVNTLLNNYNENAWELFAERGYIYDGNYKTRLLDVFQKVENRKILLNSLFTDKPEFSVKMCGNYSLDLNNCMVSTDNYYDYANADPIYKSCVPNPHLKLFSCLGGYKEAVKRELRNRNYIGAIELCIASAGSVDLDETEQTFRPFLGWVLSSREKILRRKDGVEMTPEEALIWLIDKEKANETA